MGKEELWRKAYCHPRRPFFICKLYTQKKNQFSKEGKHILKTFRFFFFWKNYMYLNNAPTRYKSYKSMDFNSPPPKKNPVYNRTICPRNNEVLKLLFEMHYKILTRSCFITTSGGGFTFPYMEKRFCSLLCHYSFTT